MGWLKENARAIVGPQIFVMMLATIACLVSLGMRQLSTSSTVSAAPDKALAETDANIIAPVRPETGLQLSPKPLSFSLDCEAVPCLALTFDDGPDPATTPLIVDALEKAGAKATFFMIGNRIAGHEAILQRIQADGFDIGNHSWSHPDFTKLKPEQMIEQINKTQAAMAAAGVEPAHMFRPPYGAQNDLVRQTVPLPLILWNVDPKDWAEKDPHRIADTVEASAKPGAIIIMHDSKPETAAAASELINRLRQHYQLVTISELVQLPPSAHGDTVIF